MDRPGRAGRPDRRRRHQDHSATRGSRSGDRCRSGLCGQGPAAGRSERRKDGPVTESSLRSLLLVMVIASVTPIVSRLVPGRPPQVLFLIVGGVLIGPQVLDIAQSADIELVAGLGLGFL